MGVVACVIDRSALALEVSDASAAFVPDYRLQYPQVDRSGKAFFEGLFRCIRIHFNLYVLKRIMVKLCLIFFLIHSNICLK